MSDINDLHAADDPDAIAIALSMEGKEVAPLIATATNNEIATIDLVRVAADIERAADRLDADRRDAVVNVDADHSSASQALAAMTMFEYAKK